MTIPVDAISSMMLGLNSNNVNLSINYKLVAQFTPLDVQSTGQPVSLEEKQKADAFFSVEHKVFIIKPLDDGNPSTELKQVKFMNH